MSTQCFVLAGILCWGVDEIESRMTAILPFLRCEQLIREKRYIEVSRSQSHFTNLCYVCRQLLLEIFILVVSLMYTCLS